MDSLKKAIAKKKMKKSSFNDWANYGGSEEESEEEFESNEQSGNKFPKSIEKDEFEGMTNSEDIIKKARKSALKKNLNRILK